MDQYADVSQVLQRKGYAGTFLVRCMHSPSPCLVHIWNLTRTQVSCRQTS